MEILCACATPARASNSEPAKRMIEFMSPPVGMSALWLRFYAKALQGPGPAPARIALDLSVQTAAVAVHRDNQRPEAPHAEFPERLRVQVVQVHVLDRLDPGCLQR